MSQIANDKFSWMTCGFFETILKSNGYPNAKLIDFVLNEAVAKGANYGSQLVRVLVNYNDGPDVMQKSFVIKTGFSLETMSTTLLDLFRREITFYRDIMPKMEKYQQKVDPNFKCAPKCYQIGENPFYFVFEDLKDGNFSNLDRHAGLTFDATAMVVLKLAKSHAITSMIYEESPELFKPYMQHVFNVDTIHPMLCGLSDCQQVCLKWPGYEHYSKKIKYFLDHVVTKTHNSFDVSNDNTFATLIHGDLWVNNIMYKFDEMTKTPVDVLMVDYQIGYYGSPILDLAHLLYTSTLNEIREREWDKLIQIYHTELIKSLDLLEYRGRTPTLTELQIQLLKRSSYALLVSFMVFRYVDSADDANIEMLVGNSDAARNVRYKIFEKPAVKQRIQYLLDFFDRKGFLNEE